MAASLTSSRFVVLVEVVGAVALDTSSKACADLQYAAADSALYTQHSCQASVAEFHPAPQRPVPRQRPVPLFGARMLWESHPDENRYCSLPATLHDL